MVVLVTSLNGCELRDDLVQTGSGPLLNLEKGELRGHLNPNTGWGFINRKGEAVLPFKYTKVFIVYREAETLLGGIVSESEHDLSTRASANNVLIDFATFYPDGKPKQLITRTPINENNLKLLMSGSTNPSLFSGKEVNRELSQITVGPFKGNFAITHDANKKTYGLVNDVGDWTIRPQTGELSNLGENEFSFQDKNSRYGLMDCHGKILLPPKFSYISKFNKGVALCSFGSSGDHKFQLVNNSGIVEFEQADLSHPYAHCTDLIAVCKMPGKKYGAIDRHGKTIVPFIYEYLRTSEEGMLIAKTRAGEILIDSTNKQLSPAFDSIQAVSGDSALVGFHLRTGDRNRFELGIWNRRSGKTARTGLNAFSVTEYQDGMVICKVPFFLWNRWIVLNPSGKMVIDRIGINYLDFGGNDRIICHYTDSSLGYLDYLGRPAFEGKFTDARAFDGDYAPVSIVARP